MPPPSTTPLSAADAEKVLKDNLRNLRRKVKEGRTLSAGEVNLLRAVQTGGKAEAQAFAANQVELAALLGVNRKTIQRALKRDGHPGTRADGRYDVNAWREFVIGGSAAEDAEDADDTNPAALKARNLLLQNERLELQIAVMRGDFVAAADVEKWGAELGANVRKIVTQIHLAAPSVVGLSVPDAEARLKEIEDEILQQLHVIPERIERLKHEPTE